jgi:hypothetical protein
MATVIRLDRIPYPNPVSVMHSEEKGLENGAFIGENGFREGYLECYDVQPLKAGEGWLILACDVLQYDERLDERDFVLLPGKAGRAYIPQKGEMYTIAKSHFDSGDTLKKDDKLQLKDGTYQLKLAEEGSQVAAVVRKVVRYAGQESLKIEIR